MGKDLASKWFGSHSDGTGPYVLSAIKSGVVLHADRQPSLLGREAVFHDGHLRRRADPRAAAARAAGRTTRPDLRRAVDPRPRSARAGLERAGRELPGAVQGGRVDQSGVEVFGKPAMRAALRAGLDNSDADQGRCSVPTRRRRRKSTRTACSRRAPPPTSRLRPRKAEERARAVQGRQARARLLRRRATRSRFSPTCFRSSCSRSGSTSRCGGIRQSSCSTCRRARRSDPTSWSPSSIRTPPPLTRGHASIGTRTRRSTCSAAPRRPGDSPLDKARAKPSAPGGAVVERAVAAEAYRDSNCWLNISDVHDTVVTQQGITGFRARAPVGPHGSARDPAPAVSVPSGPSSWQLSSHSPIRPLA